MQIRTSEISVAELIAKLNSDVISLQPDFQRQEVWPLSKKKALIDSILRGWVVPPLHLVDDGKSNMEVLDGQQRLTAIRDFFDNRLSIDGRQKPSNPSIAELHGQYFRDLSMKWQRKILAYTINAHIISDFTPEEPGELFYRLNQPTTLTSGEKRNSLFGPARDQLRNLVQFFEGMENNTTSIGFSNVRYGYDDVFARVLYFLEERSLATKGTESRISERFREDIPFGDDALVRTCFSIEAFSKARARLGYYRFNKASLMSWLIFYSRFYAKAEPEPEFMSAFLHGSESGRLTLDGEEALGVFNDRASLRVTDVSSVVYRDFVLNYLYFSFYERVAPHVPIEVIVEIKKHAQKELGDISFAGLLEQHLDIKAWSATL